MREVVKMSVLRPWVTDILGKARTSAVVALLVAHVRSI
jgi:hypothetical protein